MITINAIKIKLREIMICFNMLILVRSIVLRSFRIGVRGFDIRKWHDLVSPCGHTVEVKVRNPMKIAATLSELSMLRADPRRYLQSDWVFIFTMEGRETYNLHGTYKWNDGMGEYMSETFDWKSEYEVWSSLNADREFLINY